MNTLEVGQDQQGHVLLSQVGSKELTAEPGVTHELRDMAAAYLRIDLPDWAERTRAKDDAANAMGLYVVEHRIPRDELIVDSNEGLILALASAVLLDPQPEDADRLLGASRIVNRLHIRYRIILAFSRLLERRMLSRTQIESIKTVLGQFTINADQITDPSDRLNYLPAQ